MTSRRTFLVIPVVALAACSRTLEILVFWSEALTTFQLRDSGGGLPITESVSINSFFVFPQAADSTRPDYDRPVWAFGLRPGDARELTDIVYGRCPVGFTEIAHASSLRAGGQYAAVAVGPGCAGELRFLVPTNAVKPA